MKNLIAVFLATLASPAFADVVCYQGADYQMHCVNRGADVNLSPSILNGPANLAAQIQQQQLVEAQIELLKAQAEAIRKAQEGK